MVESKRDNYPKTIQLLNVHDILVRFVLFADSQFIYVTLDRLCLLVVIYEPYSQSNIDNHQRCGG